MDQILGDHVDVRSAGDDFDNPAEQGVAEVRISEARARHTGQLHRGGQDTVEPFSTDGLLPVSPRVIRGQSTRHCHEHANGRGYSVTAVGIRLKRRYEIGYGCVKVQEPTIAQQEERRRSEALGAGRDPKRAVSVR